MSTFDRIEQGNTVLAALRTDEGSSLRRAGAVEDYIEAHNGQLDDHDGPLTPAEEVYRARVQQLEALLAQSTATGSEDGIILSPAERDALTQAVYDVNSAAFHAEDRFDEENAHIDSFDQAPPATEDVFDEQGGGGARIDLGQTDAANGGTAIADIQQILLDNGYFDLLGGGPSEVDGHFGPRTRQAVLAFQRDRDDLAVTGTISQDDLQALARIA